MPAPLALSAAQVLDQHTRQSQISKGMIMDNLLENGDFATNQLGPWTTTAGDETWTIKPNEGDNKPDYYLQLSKGGNLSQSIPEGSYKPTALTFEVRAGETVKPGDFVLFSYAALCAVPGGAAGFGDVGGATADWRLITLAIDIKPDPASTVMVQVHTASDTQTLKAQAGTVHFRNFRLI
jgi:hypothetical protein